MCQLPIKPKISTFFIGLKQDTESHNTIFKMFRIQSIITPYSMNRKMSTCIEKYNQQMPIQTQMLGLLDKDVKAANIKMLKEVNPHTL